jgi:hypothetical protein
MAAEVRRPILFSGGWIAIIFRCSTCGTEIIRTLKEVAGPEAVDSGGSVTVPAKTRR